MVWFECTDCGESLKKPKVQNHTYSCCASAFNCIDCGRTFDRHTVKDHTTCVTEHDKYAKGATKPGGFAAQGFYGSAEKVQAQAQGEATGTEFLSARPPWSCSVCNVTCTSRETLMGHAAGTKHKRRARAASNAQQAANGNQALAEAQPLPSGPAASPAQPAQTAQQNGTAQEKPALDHASASGTGGAKAEKKKKRKLTLEQPAGKSAAVPDANSIGTAQNGKPVAEHSEARPGKRKRQQGDAQEAGHANRSASPSGNASAAAASQQGGEGGSFQWKKLAAQVLSGKGSGHRMKLRKLQLKVLEAAGLPAADLDQHGDAMLRRWSKSSKFSVEDGHVALK